MHRILFLLLLFSFSNITFAQKKITIAVMDLSGEGISASETRIITSRLRTDLFNTNKFTVVERERMKEILKEQGIQLIGCTSNECIVEAGKLLGVKRIVAGEVGRIGNLFTLSIRMIDVETGEILRTATEDCECRIEIVLTTSVKNVAQILSGENISIKEKNGKTSQEESLYVKKHKLKKNRKLPKFYIIPKIGFSTITGIGGLEIQYMKFAFAYGTATLHQEYFDHYLGLKYYFNQHESSLYLALNFGRYAHSGGYDELKGTYITQKDNFLGFVVGYRLRTIWDIETNIGLGHAFIGEKKFLQDFSIGLYF